MIKLITHLKSRVAVTRPLRLKFALALLLVAGIGRAQDPAPAGTASVGTNGAPANVASAAEVAAQAELIQKLLNRIDQLEQKDVDRAQAAETVRKTHEEREEKLLGRIGELESKVGSLEAGRVLPEITIAAEDGPTVQDVDQKIRILERKGEIAAEAADARSKEAPKLSVGQNGFSFSSADTNFVLKIRGLVQADSRTFINDNPRLKGNDSFLLRRARPILEGTVFRDFDFQIVPDFGGSSVQVFDANLNYRLLPEVQLRAGKFKSPVGLEQLQSDATLPFNERSLATAFIPTRSVGLQLWGDIAGGVASYALGAFNGSGDSRPPGNSDFADEKEFAGRLFFQPFKQTELAPLQGLGFGVGVSYSLIKSNASGLPNTTGGTLPGYVTDGQQQFFAYNPLLGTVVADGPHWRIAPQASYLFGPFGLLGEYTINRQEVLNNFNQRRAQLEHTAWQVSAQWVLTGEPASFTGINPKKPFDPFAGRWGAWQLVARYGQLDIDGNAFPNFANSALSATAVTSWSVGINWWLNKNVRFLTSFAHTTFDGGGSFSPSDSSTFTPPATVTHQNENVVFTRLQLAF